MVRAVQWIKTECKGVVSGAFTTVAVKAGVYLSLEKRGYLSLKKTVLRN